MNKLETIANRAGVELDALNESLKYNGMLKKNGTPTKRAVSRGLFTQDGKVSSYGNMKKFYSEKNEKCEAVVQATNINNPAKAGVAAALGASTMKEIAPEAKVTQFTGEQKHVDDDSGYKCLTDNRVKRIDTMAKKLDVTAEQLTDAMKSQHLINKNGEVSQKAIKSGIMNSDGSIHDAQKLEITFADTGKNYFAVVRGEDIKGSMKAEIAAEQAEKTVRFVAPEADIKSGSRQMPHAYDCKRIKQ